MSADIFFKMLINNNRTSSFPHQTLRHSQIRSPPQSWSCWTLWLGSVPSDFPPPHPQPGCSAGQEVDASPARGGRFSPYCSYEK